MSDEPVNFGEASWPLNVYGATRPSHNSRCRGEEGLSSWISRYSILRGDKSLPEVSDRGLFPSLHSERMPSWLSHACKCWGKRDHCQPKSHLRCIPSFRFIPLLFSWLLAVNHFMHIGCLDNLYLLKGLLNNKHITKCPPPPDGSPLTV